MRKTTEHDLLNRFDVLGCFRNDMDGHAAFIQNVDGGAYIIIARQVRIER